MYENIYNTYIQLIKVYIQDNDIDTANHKLMYGGPNLILVERKKGPDF